MDDTKNALAELAEWLEEQVDSFPVLANQFAWQDTRDVSNIKKIRRIVAELAKAEKPIGLRTVGTPHLADILESDKNRVVEIVRNCRAIAEEGEPIVEDK